MLLLSILQMASLALSFPLFLHIFPYQQRPQHHPSNFIVLLSPCSNNNILKISPSPSPSASFNILVHFPNLTLSHQFNPIKPQPPNRTLTPKSNPNPQPILPKSMYPILNLHCFWLNVYVEFDFLGFMGLLC